MVPTRWLAYRYDRTEGLLALRIRGVAYRVQGWVSPHVFEQFERRLARNQHRALRYLEAHYTVERRS